MAFIVAALLPIGKLAKAGKLGTAGTKVMQSIETGVKQFKNTVKSLEAVVGQKVKSYGWNEADLAYDAQLADGSTRSVSKAELDGGSGASVADWMTESPNFKNGVYEMHKGMPVKSDAFEITLGYNNGKFGTVVPNSPYLRNINSPTDFVMFSDGSFAFGLRHELLSGDKPVRYVGEINFSGAKKGIDNITNGSGHFTPNAKDLEGIELVKKNLKKQFGLTEDIPFVEHVFSN